MRHLNAAAQKIFAALVEGIAVGTYRKLDNAPGTYQALYVNRLTEDRFSIAHYVDIGGDRVCDPDMSFWRDKAGNFYPVECQLRTGYYTRAINFGADGQPASYKPHSLRDLCSFAATWLANIKSQQAIKLTRTPRSPAALPAQP